MLQLINSLILLLIPLFLFLPSFLPLFLYSYRKKMIISNPLFTQPRNSGAAFLNANFPNNCNLQKRTGQPLEETLMLDAFLLCVRIKRLLEIQSRRSRLGRFAAGASSRDSASQLQFRAAFSKSHQPRHDLNIDSFQGGPKACLFVVHE